MNKHRIVLGALVTIALGFGNAAQAAEVHYQFSASGAAGAGQGSFAFDDAAGSVNTFGETEFELTSFSFDFGSASFDLGDLDPALRLAIFDGSTLRGLEAVELQGAFAFVPGTAFSTPFVSTARATSDLNFRLGLPVPEPGTLALGIAAVLAAAARRRGAGAPSRR